ncbi:MAG: DUF721 domain-containing protein [Mesorhizobium amorphae]|nr:MAG: DUF721 domain-containing protein [Mesorhizobium amorphae]
MAAGNGFGNTPSRAVPLSDLSAAVLDPVLRKRAGLSVALLQSWEAIVGAHVGSRSRPEKVQWSRRVREGGDREPAVLVIACEGMAALELQHEAGEIVARVNRFLGYEAIARVKLVQKPLIPVSRPPRPEPRALTASEAEQVASTVAPVENEGLREALERLGASVLRARRK